MELSTAFSILAIIIVPIVTYLLNKKDAAQEKQLDALKELNEKLQKQIDLLFKKHDDDAAALAALQLQIAKEHYLKHELDARFQSLEHTFRQGFDGLSSEFKELSRILIAHVTKEDSKG
jgi:type III secretory pathway component EscV